MSEAASSEPAAAPPPEDKDYAPQVRANSSRHSLRAAPLLTPPTPRCLPQQVIDDESSLEKEEALPQADSQKEINDLEEEANLPIEEVIRRMKTTDGHLSR